MIHSLIDWFKRRRTPTLREMSMEAISVAQSMNDALNELAQCDCTEGMRRVMDRARRMEGIRTRHNDHKGLP